MGLSTAFLSRGRSLKGPFYLRLSFLATRKRVYELLKALPDACDTAIQQIDDRMYAADFRDDYDDILCYGIAFFKKRCMVRKK